MSQSRVLVLDDNEAILAVVIEALRYENFEVRDTPEGRFFFENVREFRPDLILLDYKLSEMNGGDLCTEIKSVADYRHIPVIIFSAYFNTSDAQTITGCDGFLYKPFDLEELLAAVYQHLPQASQQN